ncbi:lasso peptide biosynthesis B2 protein [Streptomyces pseudovenezuelae]|uniref:Lasso peptide biosynthesis B2 protein n=1 Tax=Streptomyces pseudovenezuelae TaxID=67350 RepID=A0ABZ1WQV9_9ACTN|nr:lasso peptide biosynthesis B2 protein [Streptomyces pseudovenezuelae]
MSMPVVSERAGRISWHRHLTARCAVGAAHLLAKVPPRRLRRVLRTVSRGSRPATAAQTLDARTSVVSVSAWCAGQGCLERSIATVLLCRLHGTWPDWCTGVRTRPFRAHAWVEAEGRPVGEPEDTGLFRAMISVRHPATEQPR